MRPDRIGLWLLTGGAGLVAYGVAVHQALPGLPLAVRAAGAAGYVPIFAGLVLGALGAVMRFGD